MTATTSATTFRFIPAPAGNSGRARSRRGRPPVHPRACGEQYEKRYQDNVSVGSSPRLRGTVHRCILFFLDNRFIPAPAGNRTTPRIRPPSFSVHPRACGEQWKGGLILKGGNGSSPRLRGTVFITPPPRVLPRFIPAPAGNRVYAKHATDLRAVHPRACGEQVALVVAVTCIAGSSPRLRGTVQGHHPPVIRLRFIPAPAGNSSRHDPRATTHTVHPRACGEQGLGIVDFFRLLGSSPRLRGTVARYFDLDHVGRFIPAPAGNSLYRRDPKAYRAVHPRACGEQVPADYVTWPSDGSSPRLRGTEALSNHDPTAGRFIPAPAGNRRFSG